MREFYTKKLHACIRGRRSGSNWKIRKEKIMKAVTGRNRILIILAVVMCLLCSTATTAFAASGLSDDPALTIVSPTKNAVMQTGKVLISVKMTAPRTIKMSFYDVNNNGDKKLVKAETYSSDKNLSYYTKQMSGLESGVYCINVSTLSGGKAIYASELYIKIEKKTADSVKVDVFNSRNTTNSFWSSLLKKLLG